MPALLCYGDSLTWGADPAGGPRHAPPMRWPGALRAGLDAAGLLPDLDIITEGLRGRTTAYAGNPSPAEMNGAVLLPHVLHSHAPLDAVAIMLGTNDIWTGVTQPRIMRGLERLVEIVRSHPTRVANAPQPQVLLLAPPPMVESPAVEITGQHISQSHSMGADVAELAAELGCAFFDAGTVAEASHIDGVHLSAEATQAIGLALVPVVAGLFSA